MASGFVNPDRAGAKQTVDDRATGLWVIRVDVQVGEKDLFAAGGVAVRVGFNGDEDTVDSG